MLLLALSPASARAQWIVNDPANLAQAVQNGVQMYEQLQTARSQYQRLRRNLRKLRDPNFRDIAGIQRTIDNALQSAGGLAYSTSRMDARFRAMFPGQVPEDRINAMQSRMQKMLGTMQGTLRSLRDQSRQIGDSFQQLQDFKRQLRTIQTPQQAREFAGTIQAYQAQETMLLRKSIMAMTNQQAAMNAYRVNQRRQALLRGKKLLENLNDMGSIQAERFDGEWDFLDN